MCMQEMANSGANSVGARALRRRGVSCAPCRRATAVRGRRCEISRGVTICTCKKKRPSRRSGQHALHVCPRSAAKSCPLTLCPLHRHRPTETAPLNKEVDVRARRSASAMKNRLEQGVSNSAARQGWCHVVTLIRRFDLQCLQSRQLLYCEQHVC